MTIRIPTWAIKVSNWIDDTFLPLPKEKEAAVAAFNKVERSANYIQNQIPHCANLTQTEMVRKMIVNFKTMYKSTPQVQGWAGSLLLQLYRKEDEIIMAL